MQPHTENRALQIALPQRQLAIRPAFALKPARTFLPSMSYGVARKPFLVSPGMPILDRPYARLERRSVARSAAGIRQREIAAHVIAIDFRRPAAANSVGPLRKHRQDQQQMQPIGPLNAFRPVARLGHQIASWLRPSRAV